MVWQALKVLTDPPDANRKQWKIREFSDKRAREGVTIEDVSGLR